MAEYIANNRSPQDGPEEGARAFQPVSASPPSTTWNEAEWQSSVAAAHRRVGRNIGVGSLLAGIIAGYLLSERSGNGAAIGGVFGAIIGGMLMQDHERMAVEAIRPTTGPSIRPGDTPEGRARFEAEQLARREAEREATANRRNKANEDAARIRAKLANAEAIAKNGPEKVVDIVTRRGTGTVVLNNSPDPSGASALVNQRTGRATFAGSARASTGESTTANTLLRILD